MSKTVTLRLEDDVYRRFRRLAERDNRPISNFIETAALRFIERGQFVDEFEMDEIRGNKELNESLKRAQRDAEARRGRFV
ncbi:MAG: ribbon-helix-helix protein, CopG family [Planctomycetes bacterium]|nr:ribbon-helix-helix protein, CopG family [Planctomycetota bacterium]